MEKKDEDDEKKEAEEKSKRREHLAQLLFFPSRTSSFHLPHACTDPHGVKFSTSVCSLANQNSLKHNGCARLHHANVPNYSTAAFK